MCNSFVNGCCSVMSRPSGKTRDRGLSIVVQVLFVEVENDDKMSVDFASLMYLCLTSLYRIKIRWRIPL